MKWTIHSSVLIKFLFILATISLVGVGQFVVQQTIWPHALATQYIAFLGTWLLYVFDWRAPLKKGGQRVFMLQALVLGFVALPFLTFFQWSVIGFIALLSIIYQVQIPFVKVQFQFKKRLLVKNTLIGLSWAALIPLGAGHFSNTAIQFLFWFMAVQVGYGSVIRDITDIAHDQKHQLQTLPIIFGVSKTIWILQLVNWSSFLFACYFANATNLQWLYVLAFLVICYKSLLLYKVKQNHSAKLWTQYLNISTCMLIFVLTYLLS
jgi:4-hydroxybenzoate polyprenyltransferase